MRPRQVGEQVASLASHIDFLHNPNSVHSQDCDRTSSANKVRARDTCARYTPRLPAGDTISAAIALAGLHTGVRLLSLRDGGLRDGGLREYALRASKEQGSPYVIQLLHLAPLIPFCF